MVTNTKNDSEQWNELVRVWEINFRLAQGGQNQLNQLMQSCYKEGGENPTTEIMDKISMLWEAEKQARAAMDAFIAERFY